MTDIDTAILVAVRMNGSDFERLASVFMQFDPTDSGWAEQIAEGRFRPYQGDDVRTDLNTAYWFDRWSDVLLARSFLEAQGVEYQILDDEATVDGRDPHVILTNFTVRSVTA